jgi:hypothetical protein
MYLIDQHGSYYEGDRQDSRDVEVPQRPNYTYKWTGKKWVEDSVAVSESIKRDLSSRDLVMIRGIDDLYDILLKKKFLDASEVPEAVLIKLEERKAKRKNLK